MFFLYSRRLGWLVTLTFATLMTGLVVAVGVS